jgi:hypothetical protein
VRERERADAVLMSSCLCLFRAENQSVAQCYLNGEVESISAICGGMQIARGGHFTGSMSGSGQLLSKYASVGA